MHRASRFIASLALVVTGGLFAAASMQPPAASAAKAASGLPVVSIQEVQTDSPQSYALWMAEVNKEVKAKFGLDNYFHVFIGEAAGPDSGKAFSVVRAESFAAATANWQKIEKDLELTQDRMRLAEIRKVGPQVLYKAVRWDGSNAKAAVMNTRVVLSDEAGYLKALDGLRALLDGHDFKDVKINCYRVAAGRTEFTHLVSLNCASVDRRAAMMDAISSEAWAQEWIASAAKFRTTVSNGTYREITR